MQEPVPRDAKLLRLELQLTGGAYQPPQWRLDVVLHFERPGKRYPGTVHVRESSETRWWTSHPQVLAFDFGRPGYLLPREDGAVKVSVNFRELKRTVHMGVSGGHPYYFVVPRAFELACPGHVWGFQPVYEGRCPERAHFAAEPPDLVEVGTDEHGLPLLRALRAGQGTLHADVGPSRRSKPLRVGEPKDVRLVLRASAQAEQASAEQLTVELGQVGLLTAELVGNGFIYPVREGVAWTTTNGLVVDGQGGKVVVRSEALGEGSVHAEYLGMLATQSVKFIPAGPLPFTNWY